MYSGVRFLKQGILPRALAGFVLLLATVCAANGDQLLIDVSGSIVEVKDQTTIRVRDILITVPETGGRVWADFRWDPIQWVFVPVAADFETPTGLEGTWAFSLDAACDGIVDFAEKWTFHSNGLVSARTGATLKWSKEQMAITVETGDRTYTGQIDTAGQSMSGQFTDASSVGCWTAKTYAPVQEQSWTFEVPGASPYSMTLRINADRTFTITLMTSRENASVCLTTDMRVVQNWRVFGLSADTSDLTTARVTFAPGWSGCEYIHRDEAVMATVSDIPSWFDFGATFAVNVGPASRVLEPDGTSHVP